MWWRPFLTPCHLQYKTYICSMNLAALTTREDTVTMFQPGLPKKSEAQKTLREIKARAAKAAEDGDRVAARQDEALAEFVTEKLNRGDYDD